MAFYFANIKTFAYFCRWNLSSSTQHFKERHI